MGRMARRVIPTLLETHKARGRPRTCAGPLRIWLCACRIGRRILQGFPIHGISQQRRVGFHQILHHCVSRAQVRLGLSGIEISGERRGMWGVGSGSPGQCDEYCRQTHQAECPEHHVFGTSCARRTVQGTAYVPRGSCVIHPFHDTPLKRRNSLIWFLELFHGFESILAEFRALPRHSPAALPSAQFFEGRRLQPAESLNSP